MFDPDPERKALASDPLQEVLARGHKMLLSCCHDVDVALKSVGPLNMAYSYLRLWSEDTYRIKVDEKSFVEVPGLCPWNVVLIEEEFHPA